MITVGTRSYIGNQIYDYQEGFPQKNRPDRTAALEDNQTFASRLFHAMHPEEPKSGKTETKQETAPYSDFELDGMEEQTVLSYILKMREHMRDICGKVVTGSAEPSFQIGSSTFTQKEWEEFLSRFDSAEEAVQAAMRAEYDGKDAAANAAGTSIANDPKKAQAVLDPAVTATKPFAADSAKQSDPKEEEAVQRKLEMDPYWNMAALYGAGMRSRV